MASLRPKWAKTTRLVTVLALAGVPAAAAVAAAQASQAPGWRVVRVLASDRHSEVLNSVVATGRGNTWVAGDVCRPCIEGDAFELPKLILNHWTGQAWSMIRPPAAMRRNVDGVGILRASSRTNVWIFVANGGPDTVLRYNGIRWTKTKLPQSTYPIHTYGYGGGPLVFGPDNVWIFEGIFAFHYTHHTWHRSLLPTALRTPHAVDAVSANDIWALGRYSRKTHPSGNRYVAMHWNGRSWRLVSLSSVRIPSARGFRLGQVVAAGPQDVWVAGNLLHAPFLLHWTGIAGGWKRVDLPATADDFDGVVRDGNHGLWLYVTNNDTSSYFYHYSAGIWTQYPVPVTSGGAPSIYSMAWIPGTQSVWAVGTFFSAGKYKGVVLKYGP